MPRRKLSGSASCSHLSQPLRRRQWASALAALAGPAGLGERGGRVAAMAREVMQASTTPPQATAARRQRSVASDAMMWRYIDKIALRAIVYGIESAATAQELGAVLRHTQPDSAQPQENMGAGGPSPPAPRASSVIAQQCHKRRRRRCCRSSLRVSGNHRATPPIPFQRPKKAASLRPSEKSSWQQPRRRTTPTRSHRCPLQCRWQRLPLPCHLQRLSLLCRWQRFPLLCRWRRLPLPCRWPSPKRPLLPLPRLEAHLLHVLTASPRGTPPAGPCIAIPWTIGPPA